MNEPIQWSNYYFMGLLEGLGNRYIHSTFFGTQVVDIRGLSTVNTWGMRESLARLMSSVSEEKKCRGHPIP